RQLSPAALVPVAVLVAMAGVSVFARQALPLAALAAAWFPTTLLPVAALPLITSLALYQENRGYLSAVAVAMIAGPVMAWWWDQRTSGDAERTRLGLRRVVLGAVFGLMMVMVVQRNGVWRDDVTLWSDVLSKAPMNQAAYVNLGGAYQARGDLEAAAAVYQRALTRFPRNAILHNNLGVIYRSHGDWGRAAEEFQAAVRLMPGFATPYYNLGLMLERTGFPEKAIASYERFLQLAPGQLGTAPNISRARQRLIELRRAEPPGLN
ncbi:MAG: tetratricopeptide repeat protein, partial [Nitrospiria bacterium]